MLFGLVQQSPRNLGSLATTDDRRLHVVTTTLQQCDGGLPDVWLVVVREGIDKQSDRAQPRIGRTVGPPRCRRGELPGQGLLGKFGQRSTAVDVGGWSFPEGINFRFPAGTVLATGWPLAASVLAWKGHEPEATMPSVVKSCT